MILTTMPGRFGDILWTLPTVRAISEAVGEPIDFAISGKYGSIAPLIQDQEYVHAVLVLDQWEIVESAPMTPSQAPGDFSAYDRVIHLGYPTWPSAPLPFYSHQIARLVFPEIRPLDLDRPWIQEMGTRIRHVRPTVAVGFSDEWFELKVGLCSLLTMGIGRDTDNEGLHCYHMVPSAPGSRWQKEVGITTAPWRRAAERIDSSTIFLGCCSALHILACALGKRVVMMEPAEARWHPIFYPFGKTGPRVTLVTGNDSRPTFDARHVRDAVEHAMRENGGNL